MRRARGVGPAREHRLARRAAVQALLGARGKRFAVAVGAPVRRERSGAHAEHARHLEPAGALGADRRDQRPERRGHPARRAARSVPVHHQGRRPHPDPRRAGHRRQLQRDQRGVDRRQGLWRARARFLLRPSRDLGEGPLPQRAHDPHLLAVGRPELAVQRRSDPSLQSEEVGTGSLLPTGRAARDALDDARPHRPSHTGATGLVWLIKRETLRVSKLWTQTVLAPVVSSALFIVVFGFSLGGRIKEVEGFPYREFIVPGLIVMAMVQAAYSNNASSVFQARSDRYINDVLSAPMRPWQMNLGFNLGGVVRALMIGAGLAAVAIPITGVPVREPLFLIPAVLIGMVLFSALGRIVGIFAETFDHHTFVNNIVILPLTFLGGVFYSVSSLGSPWEEISHINPLFYVVETIRYGFLGVSDVSPWIAFAVVAGMCLALLAWSQYLFTSGRKLKP